MSFGLPLNFSSAYVSVSVGATFIKTLKLGAGGYCTGLHISSDGLTILTRCDTFGAYIWDAAANSGVGQWDMLLTPARMPAGTSGPGGVYEILSAPSNSARIYMYCGDGNLYRSDNRGATFVKCVGWTNHASDPNAGQRYNGRRMMIDPVNPDIVYVGTNANGVFVTTDGGATFSAVTAIPTVSNGGYIMTFDAFGGTAGTTPNKTNVAYIAPWNSGVYRTTNAGGAWAATTGGPSNTTSLRVGSNSVLWATENPAPNYYETGIGWKLVSGSWSSFDTGADGNGIHVLLPDPSDPTHIVGLSIAGYGRESHDSGATWSLTISNISQDATGDIGWLTWSPNFYMSGGGADFDPSGNIWMSMGVGVVKHIPGGGSPAADWHYIARGIEQLVINGVSSSRNAHRHPVLYGWDRPTFYSVDQDQYPAQHGPNRVNEIVACWHMDWASSDGSTYAQATSWGDFDYFSTSSDGGQTWKYCPTIPATATTLTTNAPTAAGNGTLHFASVPQWLQNAIARHLTMNISDNLSNATIPANALAYSADGTTISFKEEAIGAGVASGATIHIGIASSPIHTIVNTNAVTTASPVLHFASVPTRLYEGMTVESITNPSSVVDRQIISIDRVANTVTLDANVTVGSGDMILFYAGVQGGNVAVASPSNMVFRGNNNTPIMLYTTDGGANWAACDIKSPRPFHGNLTNGSAVVTGIDIDMTLYQSAGAAIKSPVGFPGNTVIQTVDSASQVTMSAPYSGTNLTGSLITTESGFGFAYYDANHGLAADRVNIGTFYTHNYINTAFYKSTDGGATWSKTGATIGSVQPSLQAVDGHAGHVFFCSGWYSGRQLYRSTDGAATFTQITNINACYQFGFGAPKPGGSGYPSIYMYGQVGGVDGFYRSDDNCASWVALNLTSPVSYYDSVSGIDGDKQEWGRFYIAHGGSGADYASIDP